MAATQPITSLAFVFDGLHYGASDFTYAASAMVRRPLNIALIMWYGFMGVTSDDSLHFLQ